MTVLLSYCVAVLLYCCVAVVCPFFVVVVYCIAMLLCGCVVLSLSRQHEMSLGTLEFVFFFIVIALPSFSPFFPALFEFIFNLLRFSLCPRFCH